MTVLRFAPDELKSVVGSVCAAAGSEEAEATLIARRLVDPNLAGHTATASFGCRATCTTSRQAGSSSTGMRPRFSRPLVVVDGNNGFGQVIGGEAMTIGVERAKAHGACVLALRHSAHLGRIADWAEMAADQGLASFHFVNVTGIGANRVAPFGGSDGRLSTNPIAAAIPRADGKQIVLDMATSIVAEGKIAVAANRGIETPGGWLIDRHGKPTRNPLDLYGEPGGAIMPFGAYKGYGLSLFVDLFAGALTGAGGITHRHDVPGRIENNMVAMIVDPVALADRAAFNAEVARIVAFVTASAPAAPNGAVVVPGDPERATRAERIANGIPLEAETWRQIVAAGASVGVGVAEHVA